MQMSGMWGYLDSNGDGQVDLKELQAATNNNEAKNRHCDIYISISIFITIYFILSIIDRYRRRLSGLLKSNV